MGAHLWPFVLHCLWMPQQLNSCYRYAWTTKLNIFTTWPFHRKCLLTLVYKKTCIVWGDYQSTWVWVLILYHRNAAKEFFYLNSLFFNLLRKKILCKDNLQISFRFIRYTCPFFLPFRFLSWSSYRFIIFAERRGIIWGQVWPILKQAGFGKIQGRRSHLAFPPSLLSSPVLYFFSSLLCFRSFPDSCSIWVSPQVISSGLCFLKFIYIYLFIWLGWVLLIVAAQGIL